MIDQTRTCCWCGNMASEIHHIFRRSSSPELINDPNNFAELCRRCHQYATDNKEFEQLLQTRFFLKEEKELSLENIQDAMRGSEQLSPKEINDYLRYLCAEQSYYTELLGYVIKNKPPIYAEIKSRSKSMAEADREWECSETGLKQYELESLIDRCKILKSSLRIMWEMIQSEGHNQF